MFRVLSPRLGVLVAALALLFSSGFGFYADSMWPSNSFWSSNSGFVEGKLNYYSLVSIGDYAKSDVNLSVRGGYLYLKGNKKKTKGSFRYSFSIPDDAVASGLQAEYFDGILKISIPKSKESEVRNIKIK